MRHKIEPKADSECPNNAVQATDLGGVLNDFTIWGLFIACGHHRQDGDDHAAARLVLVLGDHFRQGPALQRVRAQADSFEEVFWSGDSLDELYNRIKDRPNHPMAMMFIAAMREWRRSFERRGATRAEPRPSGAHRAGDAGDLEPRDGRSGALSRLPRHGRLGRAFRRLFGTVWGIMHSFTSIAASQEPAWPWWRRASRRPCSRPPWA